MYQKFIFFAKFKHFYDIQTYLYPYLYSNFISVSVFVFEKQAAFLFVSDSYRYFLTEGISVSVSDPYNTNAASLAE